MNDAQSGHHNGDIPVPLDAVERIEVLHGPGSSLFGADAFGGTVNVITRRAPSPSSLLVEGGSFSLAGARAQSGFERGEVRQTVAVAAERSSGFMYDRDFANVVAHAQTRVGANSGVRVSVLRKEFGANNFYGGNAPSREWTNQVLIAADHRLDLTGGWSISTTASYRTHGDRFLFNQERPLLSDNRHRTHAVLAAMSGSRRVRAATVTAGVEGGGDWIRSTNLGNHNVSRVSGFGEWRQELGRRTQVDASLRLDRYSEFGTSASPALAAGWWLHRAVRVRGSVARAFRVPTFTERFYSDPANLARPEVGPESAWASEAGADLFAGGGWLLQATVFHRADNDVIDWLRPTTADRWRTYNIRDVNTTGIEVGAEKTFGGGVMMQARYTGLDLDAAAVNQLSKYVLDFAPRSFTAALAAPLPGGFHVAPRLEYRRRTRSSGTSEYALFDLRVGRRFAPAVDLFVDGTNLFNAKYEEIAGVRMPGTAMSVSLSVGGR